MARTPIHLSVLSYNIQGLPEFVVNRNRATAMPLIARQSCGYDLVLFQEDFSYHGLLRTHSKCHPHILRGPGETSTTGTAEDGFKGKQLSKLIREGKLFGSGLTALSRHDVIRHAGIRYEHCEGYFTNKQDCFADKGAQMFTVRLAPGIVLDVYNTHLEAGGSGTDNAVRLRQLDKLARFIEKSSGNRPLIIAGDFNLSWHVPVARKTLQQFIERLGLTRVEDAQDLNRPIDHIFYRSGGGIAVMAVITAGLADGFESRGRPLSDHAPITATFMVAPSPKLPDWRRR